MTFLFEINPFSQCSLVNRYSSIINRLNNNWTSSSKSFNSKSPIIGSYDLTCQKKWILTSSYIERIVLVDRCTLFVKYLENFYSIPYFIHYTQVKSGNTSARISSPVLRILSKPVKGGDVTQGRFTNRMSSPISLSEKTLRRESPTEPGAAWSVAIWNATTSPGLTDQPSISSCSKDKGTSGSSKSWNHFASFF